MSANQNKPDWRKGLLMGLCIILTLILVLICLITGYVDHLLGKMNQVNPGDEDTLSSSEAEDIRFEDDDLSTIDPDSTEDYIHIDDITIPSHPLEEGGNHGGSQEEQSLEVITGEHLVNILLVGQDRRPGQGRQRSDSMILVTFNRSTNEITLTSFMRDQYVAIPGYKPNKLNAAYQYGGMSLLTKTLLTNFGVAVDGVVEVDFGGFKDIVDLLGGVTISLTEAEVQYLNEGYGWTLTAGENHLSGEEALAYSRIRYIDSDYRRAERQRKVLTALLASYKDQSLPQLMSLLEQILPLVTTNLSKGQILNYAADLFPMLTGVQLKTMRIPVDGTFDQGIVKVRAGLTAWFQYNVDFYANNQAINEIFRKAE